MYHSKLLFLCAGLVASLPPFCFALWFVCGCVFSRPGSQEIQTTVIASRQLALSLALAVSPSPSRRARHTATQLPSSPLAYLPLPFVACAPIFLVCTRCPRWVSVPPWPLALGTREREQRDARILNLPSLSPIRPAREDSPSPLSPIPPWPASRVGFPTLRVCLAYAPTHPCAPSPPTRALCAHPLDQCGNRGGAHTHTRRDWPSLLPSCSMETTDACARVSVVPPTHPPHPRPHPPTQSPSPLPSS